MRFIRSQLRVSITHVIPVNSEIMSKTSLHIIRVFLRNLLLIEKIPKLTICKIISEYIPADGKYIYTNIVIYTYVVVHVAAVCLFLKQFI